MTDTKKLTAYVSRLLKGSSYDPPVDEFTVEVSRGETYPSPEDFTLYAHGSFPESSVMHGRPRRIFVESFDTLEEARDAVAAAGIASKTDFIDGSTYIPVESLVSHIPDDTDY